MPSPIRTVTVDCEDPYTLALFWGAVVGSPISNEDQPGANEALVETPHGQPNILFLQVPEKKTVKNRLHFDLGPNSASRDEEVERVIALGATLYADFRTDDGMGFVVLADPEGNEFCIERSDAELAATPRDREVD
ncbi:VOC family protein [Murinocardiopsis flavida]|uniref:VOC family protein n=1 Tax=Murinocardiopsis flavida TaxID=645275 RepID=UPI000D0D1D2C|nr:VOC family protein [Murinocardiopsis flavida]